MMYFNGNISDIKQNDLPEEESCKRNVKVMRDEEEFTFRHFRGNDNY